MATKNAKELKKQSEIPRNEGFTLEGSPGFDISEVDTKINQFLTLNPICKKYNSCFYFRRGIATSTGKVGDMHMLYVYMGNHDTTFEIDKLISVKNDAEFQFTGISIKNKLDGLVFIEIETTIDTKIKKININFIDSEGFFKKIWHTDGTNLNPYLWGYYSSILPKNKELEGWVGYYPNDGEVKAFVDLLKRYFDINENINNEDNFTEGTGTSCPTSGIYGGTGTKLTDIKLFLYANKVTKGTITLSKPQLEVGTYATDWRPNPTDLAQTDAESLAKKLEELTKKIEALEPKEVRKGGKKSGKKRD